MHKKKKGSQNYVNLMVWGALIIIAVVCLLAVFNQIQSDYDQCQQGIIDLPIITEQQAWCEVTAYLIAQSCASFHGYNRKANELNDRWIMSVTDKNPDKNKSCPALEMQVCKINGKIFYDHDRSKKCNTSVQNEIQHKPPPL